MHMTNQYLRLTGKLLAARKGSVFILTAFSIFGLVAATGVAVDMARAQILQRKISMALDAAGLAAGATANTVDVPTQALKYFNANFPTNYLLSGAVTLNTSCTNMSGTTVPCTDSSVYQINLSAATTQQTTFMKIAGISNVNVSAVSQITRATSGMELALVLDNSGSMGYAVNSHDSNVTKITALKCALAGDAAFGGGTTCESSNLVTTGLLDILYGGNSTLSDLYVGVVPFSDMLNLNILSSPGSSFVNNVTGSNRSSMGGCVDSRSRTVASSTDSGLSLPSNDTIYMDISDDPPASTNTYFKALTSSANNECPPASVQWMSVNKSDAVAAIQNMTPNGSTLLHLGLTWAWRMLSPNWSGIWGSSPTFTYPQTTTTIKLPIPYNTPQMLKVVVFMTDGMNNNGSNSNTSNSNSNTNNAYDTQPNFPTNNQADQLVKDVCDAMKSKGIIIYTIGFGTAIYDNPPTINDRNSTTGVDAPLLQYCATQSYPNDTSHFFMAPTNSQMEAAFQQIGNQLANLRVSQ